MANETKQIPVVGKVGEVSTSPRVMQKSKPEPDTLQKQGVRTLSELLQERKPKKVLIVASGVEAAGNYSKMLGFNNSNELTNAAALRGAANLIASACSEAGIRVDIIQISDSRGNEVDTRTEMAMELIVEAGKLLAGSCAEKPAQEKAIRIENVEKLLSKASELLETAKAAQKTVTSISRADAEEELKKHDADLVLYAAGCLCCVGDNDIVDTLREKFGMKNLFLLLASPNSARTGIRRFSDDKLFSL